jgi:hypothetical protein
MVLELNSAFSLSPAKAQVNSSLDPYDENLMRFLEGIPKSCGGPKDYNQPLFSPL